jgi:hypothetical protein
MLISAYLNKRGGENMSCRTEGHHGSPCGCGCHHPGCSCGCGGYFRFERRFATKEEKIARLEEYLESLQEEAKAVEEHIAKMKEE